MIGDLTVWENAVSERLHTPSFSRFGWIRRAAARAFAISLVEGFDIRLSGIEVLARSRAATCKTRSRPRAGGWWQRSARVDRRQPADLGLDIGAVAEIHRKLLEAAAAGAAVLVILEDLDEIMRPSPIVSRRSSKSPECRASGRGMDS